MSSKIPPEKLNVARLYADYLRDESLIEEKNRRIEKLEYDAEVYEQKLSNYRSALETLVENGI